MKIKKKGKQVDQLLKKLEAVQGLNVSIGHFEEDGPHYSGYTYPELMALHHNGVNTGDSLTNAHITPRPVMDFVVREVEGDVNKYFDPIEKALVDFNFNQAFDQIGENIVELEKSIIGSSPPLDRVKPTTLALRKQSKENTPLEDTGSLKSKVKHKLGKTVKRSRKAK